MVLYPRVPGNAYKSIDYASTLVSSVRNHYRDKKCFNPGEGTDINPVAYLQRIYKGLEKLPRTVRTNAYRSFSNTCGM